MSIVHADHIALSMRAPFLELQVRFCALVSLRSWSLAHAFFFSLSSQPHTYAPRKPKQSRDAQELLQFIAHKLSIPEVTCLEAAARKLLALNEMELLSRMDDQRLIVDYAPLLRFALLTDKLGIHSQRRPMLQWLFERATTSDIAAVAKDFVSPLNTFKENLEHLYCAGFYYGPKTEAALRMLAIS
jgi:hypothetical protein